MSYIERGIQENPSLQVLSRLAKTLEVSLDEITGPSIHPLSDSQQPVDPEWLEMIDEAIRNGVSKEEFSLYINFLKYRKNNVE
ncbi:XRE family transcriptional regulator, master regulator for biofilm formation [Mesobacillus persicus]|uniref:XRE family transcriptional regulator, master regulator for biofilm formation n=1 Tax=Mesobacillus persicus TaxID=930146 RepID=A0A1H8CJX6_9BACI|nr:helix-turn-helix domain-containing protein [Mesobacillus persicus]SEM95219.1 XRE family transcriptional regulator, master regulator for biofilm formation [Mesobacillus persicus]